VLGTTFIYLFIELILPVWRLNGNTNLIKEKVVLTRPFRTCTLEN